MALQPEIKLTTYVDGSGIVGELFAAASKHGDEVGTEAQVGDLETLFSAAWEIMTIEQRVAWITSDDIQSLGDFDDFDGII